MSFEKLNLKSELNQAITKWGYIKPTEIQKSTIPLSLQKKDIFGQSHTGTGKTAAFVLPILHNLEVYLNRNQALIVCPTRELSIQVANQVKKYAFFLKGVNVALLCGGSNMRLQLQALRKSNIVVGTPGRIIDHINRKTLKLGFLKTIVLDEADEMLKLGFKNDIEQIFNTIPKNVQTILFSATITPSVSKIADSYQNNPTKILFDNHQAEEAKNIKQYYYNVRQNEKDTMLLNIYEELNPKLSIVFVNTKKHTDHINELLLSKGIKSAVINGDKSQREREQAMHAFRQGKITALVATDVAARGIHVDNIDFVINYDLPNEDQNYTHRIGRTGRAGNNGTAITLIGNRQQFGELKEIQKNQKEEIIPLQINTTCESVDYSKKEFKSNRRSFDRNDGFQNKFKPKFPSKTKTKYYGKNKKFTF